MRKTVAVSLAVLSLALCTSLGSCASIATSQAIAEIEGPHRAGKLYSQGSKDELTAALAGMGYALALRLDEPRKFAFDGNGGSRKLRQAHEGAEVWSNASTQRSVVVDQGWELAGSTWVAYQILDYVEG